MSGLLGSTTSAVNDEEPRPENRSHSRSPFFPLRNDNSQELTRYDFYPEWGPARNRDENEPQPVVRRPRYWTASAPGAARVPAMAGARDADFLRPDDN